MKIGDLLTSAYINSNATYAAITVKAYYAVDESGRNIGVYLTVTSAMLTSIVITTEVGKEIYRSPVRRLTHCVLDEFPTSGGLTVAVKYLNESDTITLYQLSRGVYRKIAGGSHSHYITYWPWRYYWGDECPVSVQAMVNIDWATIRMMGGGAAIIKLPTCLPVLKWEDATGGALALRVFPDETPVDEWGAGKAIARKSYYTPPLLPKEVDALRSLMAAARGVIISGDYTPARLEDMTVTAEFSDGQKIIKLNFCHGMR